VSALGRSTILDQIDLIRWAEDTPNVKRFFPSEYGTDIDYDASSANEKPAQFKLKVRAFIKANIKRLQYTYLVTGPYPEMYVNYAGGDPKTGGFEVANKRATLLGDGNGKVGFTTMPE
jgi:hypothetical protein